MLGADVIQSVLGALVLLFSFSKILLFFFMALNTSPHEQGSFSQFSFPNALLLLNVLRILFAFLSVLDPTAKIIMVFVSFLPLAILLIKSPILTWKCNKAAQMLVSLVIVWMLCTMIEFLQGDSLDLAIYFVGVPAFAYLFTFLLDFRMMKVITKQQATSYQIKMLIYMVLNMRK